MFLWLACQRNVMHQLRKVLCQHPLTELRGGLWKPIRVKTFPMRTKQSKWRMLFGFTEFTKKIQIFISDSKLIFYLKFLNTSFSYRSNLLRSVFLWHRDAILLVLLQKLLKIFIYSSMENEGHKHSNLWPK